MKRIQSFPPIVAPGSRILILGSMPGEVSLAARRYYAHPQNAFWRIIGDIFRFEATAEYSTRVNTLLDSGVAVWDALKSCHRVGSGDSEIERESIQVNDFQGLFQSCPAIHSVFFNGTMAESCFRKYVIPSQILPELSCIKLPSTSPAYASMTYQRKLEHWRVIATRLHSLESSRR